MKPVGIDCTLVGLPVESKAPRDMDMCAHVIVLNVLNMLNVLDVLDVLNVGVHLRITEHEKSVVL